MSAVIGSPRFDLEYDIYSETGRMALANEFILTNVRESGKDSHQHDDDTTQAV